MEGDRIPWYLLACGVAALLLLPGLAREGMFMDGMLYTVVAHNQAHGFGTFWEPRFSQMGLAGSLVFREHPPLVFGLQALWFTCWGDAFWVERLWCLLAAVVTMLLLLRLWRALHPDRDAARRTAWWPVLLWIIIPQVHWAFHNNMLENTMGVFTLAAVVAVVEARQKAWLAGHMVAGLLVFLATMSKGLPGLFPLAAPVLIGLAWPAAGPRWRPWAASLMMTLVVAVAYTVLMAWPDARAQLTSYVNERLLHRLEAQHTVEHRWTILADMVVSLAGPAVICGVAWLLGGRGGGTSTRSGPARAMLLVGLSAVAPMTLTLVQKAFYNVPAFPFLALALALISRPWVERIMLRATRLVQRVVLGAGILMVTTAIITSALLFGVPARDGDLLHDVDRIGGVVPPGSLVGLDPDLWNTWNLQGYLMRYHAISVDDSAAPHAWWIGQPGTPPPAGYEEAPLGLRTLRLYGQRAPSQGMK